MAQYLVTVVAMLFYTFKICLGAKLEVSGSQVTITCETNESFHNISPLTAQHEGITYVQVENCPPPEVSYANALNTLNINTSQVNSMQLRKFQPPRKLKEQHFHGLTLVNLNVLAEYESDRTNWVFPDADFLNSQIPSLLGIKFSGILMPPLPIGNKIKDITLEFGAFNVAIGDCQELRNLEIWEWSVSEHDSGMLANCTNFQKLELQWMDMDSVRRLLVQARHVKYLDIVKTSGLKAIDKNLLKDLVKVRELRISDVDKINSVHRDAFKNLRRLEKLNLADSNLQNMTELMAALAPVINMHTLTLDGNKALSGCDPMNWVPPPSVDVLSMKRMNWTSMCFGTWETLSYLDLYDNPISILKLSELPSSADKAVISDLRFTRNDNPNAPANQTLMQDENEFNRTLERFKHAKNVTMITEMMLLGCDCDESRWTARALRELPLHAPGLRCRPYEELLTNIPMDKLECHGYRCVDDKCQCRRYFGDNSLSMDCTYGLFTTMPQPDGPGLKEMILEGSRIGALTVDDLPDSLEYLDLSINVISLMTSPVAEALLRRGRRVRLAQNPLACICDNPLMDVMRRNAHRVIDYLNTTCHDGKMVTDWDWRQCSKSEINVPMVASLSTLGGLIVVTMLLYQRYKYQLKIYLFSKGYFFNLLQEEEVDETRIFDAFISFSHLDDQFVQKNILPQLEEYRLCIHYRDWIAGEWIPRQIALSIGRSKRTILVMSKNFITSLWGMQEFRMAHAAALHEGKRRIIVIIVDDLETDQLDTELRAYLASNTYIKWGDPWFFEKLKYALPRIPRERYAPPTGVDLDKLRDATDVYLPVRNRGTNEVVLEDPGELHRGEGIVNDNYVHTS